MNMEQCFQLRGFWQQDKPWILGISRFFLPVRSLIRNEFREQNMEQRSCSKYVKFRLLLANNKEN